MPGIKVNPLKPEALASRRTPRPEYRRKPIPRTSQGPLGTGREVSPGQVGEIGSLSIGSSSRRIREISSSSQSSSSRSSRSSRVGVFLGLRSLLHLVNKESRGLGLAINPTSSLGSKVGADSQGSLPWPVIKGLFLSR